MIQHQRLSGGRLHLQQGPIDLVIGVDAPERVKAQAEDAVLSRFSEVLEELVRELPLLRQPWSAEQRPPQGPIACRMYRAVAGFREFVTPMAAVAGSVAEEILEALLSGVGDPLSSGLRRAYVNNGGDLALWLSPGESFVIGVVNHPERPELSARINLRCENTVRGVATSGWRGRSQSLGIADAVTVLARSASQADAAATLIANAVNVEHPGIERRPASEAQDDSDLGDRLVTTAVPVLPPEVVQQALDHGVQRAEQWVDAGRVESVYLSLQHQIRLVGSQQEHIS